MTKMQESHAGHLSTDDGRAEAPLHLVIGEAALAADLITRLILIHFDTRSSKCEWRAYCTACSRPLEVFLDEYCDHSTQLSKSENPLMSRLLAQPPRFA